MTRNTRLYSVNPIINGKKTQVIYSDLNVIEISFLKNIRNKFNQFDIAALKAIVHMDPNDVPWQVRQSIGADIINRSMECVVDSGMMELTIDEFRGAEIDHDPFLGDVLTVLKHMPNIPFTELIQMTHRDLIELVVICEKIYGKAIYNSKGTAPTPGNHLVNPRDLPDGGKSLQQEIDKLNQRGIPR